MKMWQQLYHVNYMDEMICLNTMFKYYVRMLCLDGVFRCRVTYAMSCWVMKKMLAKAFFLCYYNKADCIFSRKHLYGLQEWCHASRFSCEVKYREEKI